MNIHLPIDIYSPDQLSALIADIQAYRGTLRNLKTRAKITKTKHIETPPLSEALSNLLRISGTTANNDEQLEALQHDLHTALQKAPVVHITLAAPAGRTLKRQLTVWFRTQIHPQSLLTFSVRSDLGGGVILQAGSHFYDYSFKDRILANKACLTEVAGV